MARVATAEKRPKSAAKPAGKSALAVGALIDKLYDLQKAREAKAAEFKAIIDKMKEEEEKIEQHFIDSFTEDQISQMAGSKAKARLDKDVLPTIDEATGGWDALRKHIVKTGAWDLIEKRLGKTAFRSRFDAKEKVPGVKAFIKKSISVTKLR